MSAAVTATPQRSVLLDFDDDVEIAQWTPVNDVVMGGMSRSAFELAAPGIARFRGCVSLENSGGFASVRTAPRGWISSGASAFVLRVLGDGHAYKFTLRTDDGFDGVQYQSRFTAPAGEWQEARLAVDEAPDQPGAGQPVHPGTLARGPAPVLEILAREQRHVALDDVRLAA